MTTDKIVKVFITYIAGGTSVSRKLAEWDRLECNVEGRRGKGGIVKLTLFLRVCNLGLFVI